MSAQRPTLDELRDRLSDAASWLIVQRFEEAIREDERAKIETEE